MLEKFRKLLLREKGTKPLMHIAVTMNGIKPWSDKQKIPLEQAYKKSFELLNEIIELQAAKNVPILTIYLMSENLKTKEQFPVFLNELINFFNSLSSANSLSSSLLSLTNSFNSSILIALPLPLWVLASELQN